MALVSPAPGSAAFLGVARSLGGRAWRERPADPATVAAHQRGLSLSEPLARAMAARGVDVEVGESFLRPTLKALFPDPSSFAGMDAAAERLIDAVERDERVVVFADYDVDGAASAALLVRWFRGLGRDVAIYVPDRLAEGYGPSPAAFRRLKAGGADLVVTVDCGAAAHEALDAAEAIRLEVVVIDHHLMRAAPADGRAIVNPNRPDCASGQGGLAAAGVTLVLLAALNREARRRGLFEGRAAPDLRSWLDLAALAAICDVTRFTGFNRAIVGRGLEVMKRWGNPGLAALADAAGASRERAGVFEAGFILGPRINAGGRVGRADLGARLLATDDADEARRIAAELHALNARRREVEGAVFAEAVARIERLANRGLDDPVIVVDGDDWHPGVVGIVASRLRERYRRPAIVIGVDRAGDIGRGSGRSQPGVNLGVLVQEAFEGGILLAGGGHAMAAGLTLKPSAVPELRAFLIERIAAGPAGEARDWLDVDALASAGGARALHQAYAPLAPFGPGNPEPVVAISRVSAVGATPMRGGHLRLGLVDETGARLGAIAWRCADTPVGRRLAAGGGAIHVAGRLRVDDWKGGDAMLLEIDDIADPRER